MVQLEGEGIPIPYLESIHLSSNLPQDSDEPKSVISIGANSLQWSGVGPRVVEMLLLLPVLLLLAEDLELQEELLLL